MTPHKGFNVAMPSFLFSISLFLFCIVCGQDKGSHLTGNIPFISLD